ncbi:MAG: hypothetical protein KGJ80_17535 [Chloroflexota bacterium]|nr:hypothetical protein [Chloroflexota bacterium]
MADSMRKTQARVAERERRRQQEERNKNLKIAIPVVVGIVAVLAVGYSFFMQATPARPVNTAVVGPHLQVDRDQIDLGKQRLGNTVRALFNLKNTGDSTLKLNVPRTVTLLQGC